MKGNIGPLFSHWHRQKANTSATIMSHRPPVFLHPPLGTPGRQGRSVFCCPFHIASSCLLMPPTPWQDLDGVCVSHVLLSRLQICTCGHSGRSQIFGGSWSQKRGGGLGQTTTASGRPLSSSSPVPTAPTTAHTCWKGQVLIDNRAPAITVLFLSSWKSPAFSVCVCACVQKECFFSLIRRA